MFQQLYTIGRNTFIESIRQPVFVVLIFIATLALVLNPSLAAYTLEDDNKLLIDLGLSTLFIAGLFMAAFTATGVLNAEIENKTVLTVVSKPIARPLFVVGKFLGVAAALGVAYWVLSLVFLLTIRHQVMQTASDHFDGPVILFGAGAMVIALLIATLGNYFYQWVFSSSFVYSFASLMTGAYLLVLVISRDWSFQSVLTEFQKHDGQLAQLSLGLLMVFEAVLILSAVAIAASTRLGQIMTLAICSGVFIFGLVSEHFLGDFAEQFAAAKLIYWITPNLQLLWPADALTQGHHFTGSYISLITGYCLLYITAILAIAVGLFQTREVG